MIAAIFQKADGSFAIFRFAISLFLLFILFCLIFVFLPNALKTGRIPFAAGSGISRTRFIERTKQPTFFWFLFAGYCLLIPLFLDMIITGCLGPGHGFL